MVICHKYHKRANLYLLNKQFQTLVTVILQNVTASSLKYPVRYHPEMFKRNVGTFLLEVDYFVFKEKDGGSKRVNLDPLLSQMIYQYSLSLMPTRLHLPCSQRSSLAYHAKPFHFSCKTFQILWQ